MKILTIILGQTRSHELTWENFKTNVLDHLESDLALCVGTDTQCQDKMDPFFKNAKYTWTYPEQDDWADAFNFMSGGDDNWRILLNLQNQLFGGIKNCGHDGSAGILLFFRWFLREKLIETDVVNEYDIFIITRSDYYYDSPHPLIDSTEHIWLPEGESYGGISDRHMVIPRKYILQSLNVTERMMRVPGNLYETMKNHHDWNIEKYLSFHFILEKLYEHVRYFPRIMYAVRSDTAPTRWAEGYFEPEVNMRVKYPSEYQLTKEQRESRLEELC
jgi:hypothetical protein